MKIYSSKSSISVRLITTGILISVGILIFSLFILSEDFGIFSGIIISTILLGTLLYFYVHSLNQIIVGDKHLILEKPFVKIVIPFSEITKIEKLEYSNLTMTYGSQGVFGYIGNTMDNSTSLVKDRKNMLRVFTNEKNFIISSERSDELVNDLRIVVKKPKLEIV